MARKKITEEQPMEPKQPTPQQQDEMVMQMAQQQEMEALQRQQAVLNQEETNKAHDTEFSQFSEGKGAISPIKVIGEEQVKTAYDTLMKYKSEKANLEKRLAENEEYWKMNHWNYMSGATDDGRVKPKSAWLFNLILNKHADAMDNYPEANILPRERSDEMTAKILSDVIPVILEQNEFEQTYSDVQWYKQKHGTGVYGVFWNNDKRDGLGDVDIKKISLANIFWKGGLSDIQDSPNFFSVEMLPDDEINARYPDIDVKGNNLLPLSPVDEYSTDENVDYSNQTAVIDWYYRKRIQMVDENGIPQTKTVLHYCKFCNGQVIYASENDPNYAEKGWYQHGKYPFVFDVLYPSESSATGIGYIDIEKDEQMYIDKLKQAIIENAHANARPRWAVREDGGLNEEEFLDLRNPIIHFSGNLGEDAYKQIVASPLSPIYETVLQSMIQEMKDTSGNTAVSQGQATSTKTASGIASLQEAAGKLSRDSTKQAYRAYKKIVELVIELIREFYNEPRCFRIAGETQQPQYVDFDNAGLLPQKQGSAFGIDLGNRLPIMDIEVKPQKKNAYSKDAQNQTALNLYNLGFFAPNNADASLACLDMMDFDQIEKIRERVAQNGTLYQQVMQLQQMLMQLTSVVDAQNGTNMTEQIASGAQANANIGQGGKKGSIDNSKGSLTSQAANATRESTSV